MGDGRARGLRAEELVQQEFERRGYRLLYRRWKTPVAEIDLVMASLCEFVLVEVKSLSPWASITTRVSRAQKLRLLKAQIFLQDRWRADVRLVLAFVRHDGKILLFNMGEQDLH